MATASLELLSDLAPDVAPVDPDDDQAEDTKRAKRFLGYAAQEAGVPAQWGDLYATAVVWLAAHKLTLRARRARTRAGDSEGVGPVTSKKTGDWSESYATPKAGSAAEAQLLSTTYGAEYLALRRQLVAGPTVA